jgi:propionate catabolism operon transcriptional regulator
LRAMVIGIAGKDNMTFTSGKIQLALVVHSMDIADEVRRISDPDVEEVSITLVDLDEAEPTARSLLSQKYDVILGHGGTGALMTQQIGHSVVNIPTQLLEVIHALQQARTRDRRIAITSFGEPRDGMDMIGAFLDIDLRQIVFNATHELESGVRAAIDSGYRIIVGGGVSRKMATGLKGHGVIIRPNPKSIRQALIQARAIAMAKRREQQYTQQLQTTLQIIPEGVMGIDGHGRLNFCNRSAGDILGEDVEAHVGQSFTRMNQELGLMDVLTSGTPQIDEFKTIRGRNLLINSLPIRIDDRVRGAVALIRAVESIQNIHRKLRAKLYKRGFSAKHRFADIQWHNPRMGKLIARAGKFAASDGTILIQGETGTGKELLAHGIHQHSSRRDRPFVAINCAALPENLLESELFGYEEGAFTGAKKGGKIGLFELASSGTIFLDEIGDITPGLQLRLLRVLEAREVMRLGGDRIVPVDVRVIASTHRNLNEEVDTQRFRADLYYRLAQLRLKIPALRERPDDIPVVSTSVLAQYGRKADAMAPSVIERLREHYWPGNVRELNSFLESYFILLGDLKNDDTLFFEMFQEHLESTQRTGAFDSESGRDGSRDTQIAAGAPLKAQLDLAEKRIIEKALIACNNDRKQTAKRLGIGATTLWRKCQHLGIR